MSMRPILDIDATNTATDGTDTNTGDIDTDSDIDNTNTDTNATDTATDASDTDTYAADDIDPDTDDIDISGAKCRKIIDYLRDPPGTKTRTGAPREPGENRANSGWGLVPFTWY